jgi:Flp pilus assembly protein TadD
VDSTRPLAAVIDDYVREGLQSNLALRAQSLEVERSVAALDEARARYEQVLKIDPRAAVAANNLAWMMSGQSDSDVDVALQLAKTASETLPNEPEVNDTLGWLYYKKDLPALAVPWFKRSLDTDPNNPVFHYHLGLANAKLGYYVQARSSIEHALKLRPDFDGADQARKTLASLD